METNKIRKKLIFEDFFENQTKGQQGKHCIVIMRFETEQTMDISNENTLINTQNIYFKDKQLAIKEYIKLLYHNPYATFELIIKNNLNQLTKQMNRIIQQINTIHSDTHLSN